MSLKPERLQAIKDFSSLLNFLGDELGWPLDPDAAPDEITFDYEAEELRLSEKAAAQLTVRQLRDFRPEQPWGVFLIEFNDAKLYRTALRQVLRGLVPNRRKDPHLKSWQHENLLFICATRDYQQFTFAHFRGDKMQTAKLSTFGWRREDQRLRTVLEFNLPPLRWPEDDGADAEGWLKSWAKAFDKEPLTKDFFKRFDAALDAIKADLEEHKGLSSAEAYTLSQLLLERLIFLYFLQNRGWLNQQRNYLRDQFTPHRERAEEFSFYADFLEKLFWTLASAPGSAARLAGVPFLNGGLFDDDEFAPTPVRRKQNPPLQIRNATFARVFDEFLEAFNFTVREDTPLNQEVAVDPEMLGKVFESIILHAESADPEAVAPDKRKATGSYYTPRIVVHFICQEALRQYLSARLSGAAFTAQLDQLLKIDASDGLDEGELRRLKELLTPAEAAKLRPLLSPKCCDPSVGSGAFPVGLLHELVNLRRVVETVAGGYVDPVRQQGTQWLHDAKEEIIQNCLYGVDIQQQAIEICQLRLWLSLVVDYDLGIDPFTASPEKFREAIDRISQLPNLEMNFRRGDSLYDHICGEPLVIPPHQSYRHRADFAEISKLSKQLHKAKTAETKRKLRLKILDRRLDISQRVLETESQQWRGEESSIVNRLFSDETASRADRRRRIEQEVGRVTEALKKVTADRKQLDKLINHASADSAFYQKLRRLEGADFDSPLNFSWPIDFAPILAPRAAPAQATLRGEFAAINEASGQQTFLDATEEPGGFDILVGNPPFVTARNPTKRELYRERWKRVCRGTYQLICPFFELGFGLLRRRGQLGFIVSNAFAKREFGQPLVETFFPSVEVQKVVDCQGLLFPGHGTPTAILFGSNTEPNGKLPIRVTAILPGGGDLRTPPEESTLWYTIASQYDNPGYEDRQVAVYDWPRSRFLRWPVNFDLASDDLRLFLENSASKVLGDFLNGSIGRVCFTGADEIYFTGEHVLRRVCSPEIGVARFAVGDLFRNWAHVEAHCLCPYGQDGRLLKEEEAAGIKTYLRPWKAFLEQRLSYGETQKERRLAWWEYSLVFPGRIRGGLALSICEIATHVHIELVEKPFIANRANPVFELSGSPNEDVYHLTASWLNSSTALFWLKQVCYNKGAGEDEERDRFEFAGGKVEQLPVPTAVAEALQGNSNSLADVLTQLARACWERGQLLSSLALRKLFEQPGEAYHEWNAALPGYVAAHAEIATGFAATDELRAAFERASARREWLCAEMIALQEEMDWLVYAAYGLIEGGAVPGAVATGSDHQGRMTMPPGPVPLRREQRPFALWAKAEGDFARAVALIPTNWPVEQQSLWRARLELIRDNEHIRRIEQPVYKRRWDEQWKVGNRWQCGQVAYDAELIEAFSWWLAEKAEWWLEQQPQAASFDEWATALWQDARVQAAWPAVAAAQQRVESWKAEQKKASNQTAADASRAAFIKFFKWLVKEHTVPAGIPFGTPYDQLKQPVSAQVKKIRGKLNVPRERFHLTKEGLYRVAAPFGAPPNAKPGSAADSESRKRPFD